MDRGKRTKYALVLSGGGFKGAFQLGAINYINKHWKRITGREDTPMHFDIVSGVSVGALNGSMVAMNKLGELNNLWINQIGKNGVSEIYTSDLIDTNNKTDKLKIKIDVAEFLERFMPSFELETKWYKKLGVLFSEKKRKKLIESAIHGVVNGFNSTTNNFKAIADNTPLKRKLFKLLDRSKIRGIFKSGFVSLNDGKYYSVNHLDYFSKTDFVNGVLASTAMPAVWPPVDKIRFNHKGTLKQTKCNVDGGVLNISPLGDVVNEINQDGSGAKWKVFVINCHNGLAGIKDMSNANIAKVISRSVYDLMMGEIFNNDVQHYLKINIIVDKYNIRTDKLKKFESVIIQPSSEFDMGNPLVGSENLISKRMKHGYEQAKIGGDLWR